MKPPPSKSGLPSNVTGASSTQANHLNPHALLADDPHGVPLDFKKEKNQWVDNLTENVWQTCRNHLHQGTPRSELLICLVAIEDSIKTHTTRDPRGYLENYGARQTENYGAKLWCHKLWCHKLWCQANSI